MRCSEALSASRFSSAVLVCLLSLAVSHADDAPATEHETHKPQPTNRLANETSPYLLLHAHNPVDWRPWGPEALQAAKDANLPIFLSVGYSSCYWCHVMEREVFENAAIAEYLNEHFICIKVDREERPDIDDQYMLALQLYFQATGSTQGGGWPMSMFLTPDAKPFAGGTYFPAEDKEGRPGFRTVAEQIHTLWTTREADLRNNADFLASAVKRNSQPGLALERVELDRTLVQGAIDAVLAGYDAEHGGFFDPAAPEGPKFPEAPKLMFLSWENIEAMQRLYGGDQSAAPMDDPTYKALDDTLRRIVAGGIRDHLDGGFHRYSVDREWRVPHFEKMLYDQAQLVEILAVAAVFSRYSPAGPGERHPDFLQAANDTVEFVQQSLTSPDGGFYAALDAETNGIEGQYYVWSLDEIQDVLGHEDAAIFAAAYGLNEESRFEHGHVLYLPQTPIETARSLAVPAHELIARLAGLRAKLLAARQLRPALLRDEKILTNWNGLMIRALGFAGHVLDTEEFVASAEKAAHFILANLRDDEGRLLHSYAGGRAGIRPYLDDYAYLISALLELHNENEDDEWMNMARLLMDQQIEMYWDERGHGFFFTGIDHEPLLARTRDAADSVLPSANAVSVCNLLALAELTGNDDYRVRAEQTLHAFAPALKQSPAAHVTLAIALNQYLGNFSTVPTASINVDAHLAGETFETQLALAPKDDLTPAAEATAEDAGKHDKLTATAYLSVDKLTAGGECNVAVVLNIKDGWHINANPAQPKFLIPTELTAALPAELTLTDVKYPAGEEFAQQGSDEPLVVYEGRVVLYGKLKAPAAAAGQAGAAEITVRYQACNDQMCLRPMKLALKGTVAVAEPGEKSTPINQSLFKPKRPQPPM